MAPCNLCQTYDIRPLLLRSLKNTDSNGFHPRIENAFLHDQTIFALRESARPGCGLCALIQKGFILHNSFGEPWDPAEAELVLYGGRVAIHITDWGEVSIPKFAVTLPLV